MSNRNFRAVMRWVHILGGAIIGTFIYSPWGSDAAFAAATKFIVIPTLVITGLVMWQQPRVMKWLAARGAR